MNFINLIFYLLILGFSSSVNAEIRSLNYENTAASLTIQDNPAMDKPTKKKSVQTKTSPEAFRNNRFTPHISAEAQTRPKGKFAFQRAVGANLNTSLFLSAFTYAVSNRVELGTVLLYYTEDLHRFNMNLKYNFWKGEEFFWSFGFSFFQSDLDKKDLEPALQALDIGVGINAFQLLLNYLPLNSNYKFGLNYSFIDTTLIGLQDEDLSIASESEFGVDISYAFNKRPMDITFGTGWLRQSGISSLEKVEFGFGSSVRWYRPKKFLSSPTGGLHYSPKSGSVEFLLSSSLY